MFRKEKIVKKRTVLFVDDDEAMLHSIERCLLDESYHILLAKSSKEALEVLKLEKVHIIVTDIQMPDIDGRELLRIVVKMYPHIVKIVLSGYGEEADLQTAVKQGEIFKLIPKAWNREENFKNIIMEAIDHYNLQSESDVVRQHN